MRNGRIIFLAIGLFMIVGGEALAHDHMSWARQVGVSVAINNDDGRGNYSYFNLNLGAPGVLVAPMIPCVVSPVIYVRPARVYYPPNHFSYRKWKNGGGGHGHGNGRKHHGRYR